MKRSWTTILLSVGVALLLAHIGVLQYHILASNSSAEADRAQRWVNEQTERFSSDFNREIQNAYFNFQADADAWREADRSKFNEQYDYWRTKAAYPDLISGFFLIRKDQDEVLAYDRETRTFTSAAVPPDISAAGGKVKSGQPLENVDAANLTLYLPIVDTGVEVRRIVVHDAGRIEDHMRMPPVFGYLAIRLDRRTLTETIPADLTARYFSDGDYRVTITDRANNAVFNPIAADGRDATGNLLDLSPDKFIMFANKDVLPRSAAPKDELVFNSRIENKTIQRTASRETGGGTVKIEVKADGRPRTAVFSTTAKGPGEPQWTLGVQHVEGSLEKHLSNKFRSNLVMAFGMLFLVGAAVAGLIYSSHRVRKFAQRQIEFVSSVTHEFRTPLAVIYSAGENLADGVAKEDAQVAKYGKLIKGEGRKLSTMVEQILDFAGARSGRRKYSFAPSEVSDIVGNALAECRPLIEERGVEVETFVADDLPEINADKAALSQALQNLIANAIKYSNGDPWIRVTAANGDAKVRIAVEDRGIGISKKDLKEVFEPFYRSRQVVDAQIHGNGLGLSLVKQIVTAHDGSITAESDIDKGSKFTIELPRC